MNNYIFIDESGDPGLDIKSGSSRYFVMVAILFEDRLEMETLSTEIKKLSRKLFKNDCHEFHFVNEKNLHRSEFFKIIKDFNFKIIPIVVNKKESSKENNNLFYDCLRATCSQLAKEKTYCFKFDGTVSKSYKFSVDKELRVFAKNNFYIEKIKFINSKNDSLIQLADMCAGIIRRKEEFVDTETKNMFKLIKNKIV